ncbi:MAG: superoxide dismutase family protein [Novosphingobium sp.]|nr:superoxide dismutase family protein [Novosphingobium sp.]
MNRKVWLPGVAVCAVLAPLQHVLAATHNSDITSIRAELIDRQGHPIGVVSLEQTPGGVLIAIDADGLPPGQRAFHVHEKGVCNAADGFSSAGGHFNPTAAAHGLKDVHGPHAGDMPNLFVAADGSLRAEVFNPHVSLMSGANALVDADGSALIIHAGADDYLTQPTGGAGERIACAAISALASASP